MRTESVGRPAAESLAGGTGVWVSKVRRGRRPREGIDERVNGLNGQRNDQELYHVMLAQIVNPKEYNGRGGAVCSYSFGLRKWSLVHVWWLFSIDQSRKYTAGHLCHGNEKVLETEFIVQSRHWSGLAMLRYTNRFHELVGPCRTCFNCNRPGHLAKDCRGVPRNVNPVNARNPTVRAFYECGSTNHVRSWKRSVGIKRLLDDLKVTTASVT
ncbi:putative reverse transcriptase domain-containing protein [Tanacetum coccineum]